MTFVVIHDEPRRGPFKRRVKSVGDAARVAVGLLNDGKRNVRVELPSGESMDFEGFQAAVIKGELKD